MKNRIIGLDILRILSMFGIIGLHIINNGGLQESLSIYSYKYYMVLLLNVIFYTSVDIFAILSGYLCITKEKNKNVRIIELLFIVIYYCILIPIIFYGFNLFNIRNCELIETIKNIFPILKGRYWYITCYVFLFFMIPYLNRFIKSIDKKYLEKFLIILFILLSIIPNIGGMVDYFRIENGYSPFWLIYCYMIGAYANLYINKYENKKLIKQSMMYLIIAFGFNVIIRDSTFLVFGDVKRGDWFINYISPFIIIISLNLVLLFKNINIKNSKIEYIIKYLSMASFSVYIIHCHILIFDYVLKNNYIFLEKYNGFIIIALIVLFIIAIYILSTIIDQVRKVIFKAFKIDKLEERIGNKLDKIIN